MPSSLFDLTGRVALVTGGSRGLGHGIARGLADAGAAVALTSRTREEVEAAAAAIEQAGGRALALVTDAAQIEEHPRTVQRVIDHFGRLDILVNAAGLNRRQPALEITPEDWDFVQGIQLRGAFFMCQAAGRVFVEQRSGKVINIGSLTSHIGLREIANYGAAKSGILGLTRALALEWAPYNVQVNAIGPGYYKTRMTEPVQRDPGRAAWILSRIPMGRWGVPEDLAGVGVFLASRASDYVTGQIVNVDGGWLAG